MPSIRVEGTRKSALKVAKLFAYINTFYDRNALFVLYLLKYLVVYLDLIRFSIASSYDDTAIIYLLASTVVLRHYSIVIEDEL